MERKQFRRTAQIIGPLVVFGILVLITLSAACTFREDGSDTRAAGIVDIGIEQSASGVILRLDTISQTPAGMEMTFSLTLPEHVAASNQAEVLGPIFTGDQLQVENVSLLPSGLTIRMKPHVPGETVQEFTLLVDRVQDRDMPVTLEFVELPLRDDGDGMTVEGPWRFVVEPDRLPQDSVQETIDLNQTATDGQVTATVFRIETFADGLRVHYEIATINGAPFSLIDHGIRLREADRSIALPVATYQFDQPQVEAGAESSVTFVATFGPAAKSSEQLTLEFGPLFVSKPQPATFVIRQPLGQASATPIVIAGERFGLTDVSYEQEDERLAVTIGNLETGQDARVVFLGPEAPSVVIQDDQGRSYAVESYGSGMKRSDDGAMRAGDSTFVIVWPIDAEAQALTLTVERSGLLHRDLLTLEVTLP